MTQCVILFIKRNAQFTQKQIMTTCAEIAYHPLQLMPMNLNECLEHSKRPLRANQMTNLIGFKKSTEFNTMYRLNSDFEEMTEKANKIDLRVKGLEEDYISLCKYYGEDPKTCFSDELFSKINRIWVDYRNVYF